MPLLRIMTAVVFLLAVPVVASAQPARRGPRAAPLRILVADIDEWKADQEDVRKVLYSTARQMWKHFPGHELPTIVVQPQGGPIVLYARGERGEIRVKLNTGETYWSQYAYQFAHEFCHICCRYDQDGKQHKWFEESLCEAASIYVIREMAKTWKVRPPYKNWRSYHTSLQKYADDVAAKSSLPEGKTFREWFAEHREHLAKNATDRDKNRIVALQLLKHLQASPASWEAVWYLNVEEFDEDDSFEDYLAAWHKHAPPRHRRFIAKVAAEFGVQVGRR